ncbi:hypothetical protein D3C72_1452170 [compost metagenome]
MCEVSCYVTKMELMQIFTVSKIIMPLVVKLKVEELMIIVMIIRGSIVRKKKRMD